MTFVPSPPPTGPNPEPPAPTPTQFSVGRYAKFIVGILGAVSVGLTTFGHNEPWVTTVLSCIAAVGVYLVPNQTP